MVFFETPSGGAVFSTSSIAYSGSLSDNNYENNISRITENVLRRFIDPAAFDFPVQSDAAVPAAARATPPLAPSRR
jgi:N,N-dimethylformamidase